MTGGNTEGEEPYIVEFVSVGNALKVTAVDPVSLREVSMIGAPNVSQRELADLAVRKLKYVLGKENS